jgi:hypothetical protein
MAKHNNFHEATETKELRYPCYGWERATRVAASVNNLGGFRSDVPKSSLASALKMTVSPGFSQVVSAAKAFGLISGFKSYVLTENAKRYFHPTSDADKRLAELAGFRMPLAFRSLIDRFDGHKLPTTEFLANLLLKEGAVPPSWATRVAQIFVSSAKELGLIDESDILRYGAAMHDAERGTLPKRSQSNDLIPPNPPDLNVNADEKTTLKDPVQTKAGRNTWTFNEAGGTVVVETTDPLPRALWQRLQRYVTAIEPVEPGKEG